MNYCGLNTCDTANGPGFRVSLFVSGCDHHCKGCFSEKTWNYEYGSIFDDAAKHKVIEALGKEYISGLSVLGGDPMSVRNQKEVYEFLHAVRRDNLRSNQSIWLWTGWTWEDLHNDGYGVTPYTIPLLHELDVIVDGKFVEEKKDLTLKFRGSTNQRIIAVKPSVELHKIIEVQ